LLARMGQAPSALFCWREWARPKRAVAGANEASPKRAVAGANGASPKRAVAGANGRVPQAR